jgi:hypothetical protein
VRLAGDSSTRPLRGLGRNDGKASLRAVKKANGLASVEMTESIGWGRSSIAGGAEKKQNLKVFSGLMIN